MIIAEHLFKIINAVLFIFLPNVAKHTTTTLWAQIDALHDPDKIEKTFPLIFSIDEKIDAYPIIAIGLVNVKITNFK